MPLADTSPRHARPRSPRLVRALLLGACSAGLLGLELAGSLSGSLSAGAPAVQQITVSAAASSVTILEPAGLHAPGFPAARVVAPRATRSRALPAKTKPAPVKVASAAWVRPSAAGIVSPYGMRWGRMHKGIDFGAGYGAPIHAAADGVVIGSGYLDSESGYGMITLIRHSNGVVTAYAHQSRSFVSAGDQVGAGDTIGLVGSTGHSTGPHLHFEVRMGLHDGQVNPRSWLQQHGVGV